MHIKELTLLTTDLLGTKQFYEQLLGFRIFAGASDSISFAIGQSVLTFNLCANQMHPKYHFAFNIPCNQLDDALTRLAQRISFIASAKSFIIDFPNWNAKAIYFFDNNRNIVELIARADLKNASDREFNADAILCISELGLVDDEPLKVAAKLIEQTGITYFEKGPMREDFVALGNDNGLFVIPRTGRVWYPTDQPAEKWKICAVVEVNGKLHRLEFH